VVDDSCYTRDALSLLLTAHHLQIKSFDNALDFLEHCRLSQLGCWQQGDLEYYPKCVVHQPGCLVLDMQMPLMSGLELQQELIKRSILLPIIFLTAHANVSVAAQAFKAGAFDFLEKPFDNNVLLERIHNAIAEDYLAFRKRCQKCKALYRYSVLTQREKEVMCLMAKSFSSKEIAQQLKISHRTIETHRAHLMVKMQAENLTELIMMAINCELVH
jgi:FixJ family two-component response regulator